MRHTQKSATATIREALAAMKSCIKSGEPWTGEMDATYGAALDGVRAIEKAAKDLPVPGVGQWDQPEWDRAVKSILDLMRTIAKDAPEVRYVATDGGIGELAFRHGIDLVVVPPKEE